MQMPHRLFSLVRIATLASCAARAGRFAGTGTELPPGKPMATPPSHRARNIPSVPLTEITNSQSWRNPELSARAKCANAPDGAADDPAGAGTSRRGQDRRTELQDYIRRELRK